MSHPLVRNGKRVDIPEYNPELDLNKGPGSPYSDNPSPTKIGKYKM